MTPRALHPIGSGPDADLRSAARLAWASIAILSVTGAIMFAVSGNSQAMKTAWIEDLVSMVPPIAFLLALRSARRPPDAEYINGRWRAFDITFLVSAVALTGVGLALLYDGMKVMLEREHTTIGSVRVGHRLVWHGWIMIGALLLTAGPAVLLGRAKLKLARRLQLKPLHTDADMNKADWMTALAGAAGIAGIGMGVWWADAGAAVVIAGSVLKDGVSNLRHAMRDLLDARAEALERGQLEPLTAAVRDAVEALDGIDSCELRLHEEGLRLSGVLVLTTSDDRNLRARLRDAKAAARAVHWRIDDVTATLADRGPVQDGP